MFLACPAQKSIYCGLLPVSIIYSLVTVSSISVVFFVRVPTVSDVILGIFNDRLLSHEGQILQTAPENLLDQRAHWLWQLWGELCDCDCQHPLYSFADIFWRNHKVEFLIVTPTWLFWLSKCPLPLLTRLHCWKSELSWPLVGPATEAAVLTHNVGCSLRCYTPFVAPI